MALKITSFGLFALGFMSYWILSEIKRFIEEKHNKNEMQIKKKV